MNQIEWVHTDSLSVATNSPALFVFDDAVNDWSRKRIGFVYECLLELPVSIRRCDDSAAEILRFAAEHSASRVVTRPFLDPHLARVWSTVQTHLTTEILPAPPFVNLREPVDLRRFSRYWEKASKALA